MKDAFRVRVERYVGFPPERVFDAWIDPSRIPQWFSPGLGSMVRVQVDARPGGRFSIVQRREDGDVDHVGEYLVVDRPRRLSFTWSVPKYSDDTSTVTIDFVAEGAGCRVTLVHEMDPKWAAQSERTAHGWETMLRGIERALAPAAT